MGKQRNMEKREITGERFGRWLVLEEKDQSKSYMRNFLCKCDCGNYKVVQLSSLTTGRSTSCGCYKKEENINRLTKNGRAENGKHTGEYNSWSIMIQRCTNSNHERYKNYGGRGISVCDRWLESFDNFLEDMGKRPTPNHSIDRFPNINGNYEPINCRWATKEQQYRGKTDNRWVELNGERMIISDFCKKVKKPLSAIHFHLKKNRSIEEIYLFYVNKQVNG